MGGNSNGAARLERFLSENPGLDHIELLFPDINGVMRGKWLPADAVQKMLTGGIRLPISTYALDIFGDDVDEVGLAQAMGDPDGFAEPVLDTLRPVPWTENPTAQVLMALRMPDGEACVYDPRNRLLEMVARFDAIGLTPVVATELEFYIFQPGDDPSDPPRPPAGLESSQVYNLEAAARIEPLLRDIKESCDVQGIPADTLIAEYGPGQFEINFNHVDDALAAADSRSCSSVSCVPAPACTGWPPASWRSLTAIRPAAGCTRISA